MKNVLKTVAALLLVFICCVNTALALENGEPADDTVTPECTQDTEIQALCGRNGWVAVYGHPTIIAHNFNGNILYKDDAGIYITNDDDDPTCVYENPNEWDDTMWKAWNSCPKISVWVLDEMAEQAGYNITTTNTVFFRTYEKVKGDIHVTVTISSSDITRTSKNLMNELPTEVEVIHCQQFGDAIWSADFANIF